MPDQTTQESKVLTGSEKTRFNKALHKKIIISWKTAIILAILGYLLRTGQNKDIASIGEILWAIGLLFFIFEGIKAAGTTGKNLLSGNYAKSAVGQAKNELSMMKNAINSKPALKAGYETIKQSFVAIQKGSQDKMITTRKTARNFLIFIAVWIVSLKVVGIVSSPSADEFGNVIVSLALASLIVLASWKVSKRYL